MKKAEEFKNEGTNEFNPDTTLPVGVSQQQWESWKDKWGNRLKRLHIPLDDNNKEFFTCAALVPDRNVLSEFEKWMDKNPGKAKAILVNNCLVSGKDQVNADDDLFLNASAAIAELIPIRKAIIKN